MCRSLAATATGLRLAALAMFVSGMCVGIGVGAGVGPLLFVGTVIALPCAWRIGGKEHGK